MKLLLQNANNSTHYIIFSFPARFSIEVAHRNEFCSKWKRT